MNKNFKLTPLYLALLLQPLLLSAKVFANNAQPLLFSGNDIHLKQANHYIAKITVSEPAKVRCIAYNQNEPIAIDSIAVYGKYEVANFIINEGEGPVTQVKCWITSTRAEDAYN